MIKLKQCPFCDGDWGLFKEKTPESFIKFKYYVECCDCGARTGNCETREEAIEAWNRRVNDGEQ